MSEALPSGARCGRHPEVDASAICVRCGDFLCEGCTLRTREDQPCCARCEPLASEAFPWERRGEIGLVRAFAQTVIGTITRAGELFARGFRDRSVVPALAFGATLITPVAVLERWMIESDELAARFAWAGTPEARMVRVAAVPLVYLLGTLIVAASWWIGLRAVGCSRCRFGDVVRTSAYVRGSMALTRLLPLLPVPVDRVAVLAAALATLALEGEALSAVTGASRWRVAGAALVGLLAISVIACAGGALVFLVMSG